jgi:Flp pilus assembly protein TadD
MHTALRHPAATPFEIHQYGRQLIAEKKSAEALEVFQYNAERNGDAWPTHVGLARAYAATGDKQKALEHAKLALPQAPDEANRKNIEGMVKALSEDRDIN